MKEEHEVMFSDIDKKGVVSNIKKIKQSTFFNCPFYILVPEHYNEDGSCKCNNEEYRKTVMIEWGYTNRDFKKVGII